MPLVSAAHADLSARLESCSASFGGAAASLEAAVLKLRAYAAVNLGVAEDLAAEGLQTMVRAAYGLKVPSHVCLETIYASP